MLALRLTMRLGCIGLAAPLSVDPAAAAEPIAASHAVSSPVKDDDIVSGPHAGKAPTCYTQIQGKLAVGLPASKPCEHRFGTLEDAKSACKALVACGGITQDAGIRCTRGWLQFELRSAVMFDSMPRLTSWQRGRVKEGVCEVKKLVSALSSAPTSMPKDLSELGPPARLVKQVQHHRPDATGVAPTSVAVCVSGELRSWALDDPCTLHQLVERVIRPLDADVYVYLNSKDVSRAEWAVQQAFTSVRLRDSRIVGQDNLTGIDCPDALGTNNGFPLARSMSPCGAHVVPRGYDWIVRARPGNWCALPTCSFHHLH